MKKLLAFALAALLLTGCTPEPSVPTEPTVPDTTPATEEIVITYGALEFLEFDYEGIYAAAPMGDDLLLFSNMDSTTLIKVSGRNHKELASVATGVPINPGTADLQISENGVCYTAEEEYVFLNAGLEELERVTLPDAWGRGAVCEDQKTICYSTGSELWIYNRETGLNRLLRETMHTGLALEDLVLNDSVLVCQLFDHRAVPTTLFYSTATGELLASYEDSINLTSAAEAWLAKTSDGRRNQIVLGGTESRTLTGWENFSDVTLVEDGVLVRTADALHFLDLEDGTESAVALEESAFVTNAWHTGGVLWIALDDGRLCRWEPDEGETRTISCLAPYYSRENPDTEGLAALDSVITELEATYGVAIHIYEDAVAAHPEGLALRCEYQVDALTEGLAQLELGLSRFDPEFLAKVGKASDDGRVHICLVRSVSGGSCIQFWDEGGNARIVLAVNDGLQKDFFHGLAHIIDARIMTKTTAFDGWKNLNPKGFQYSYDLSAEADTGEFPGAFADSTGMVSPVEDRASVFAAAMAEDAAFFENETAQRKLATLCTGIRKAFGLKDSEETFPWEQYLAE